MERVIRKPGLAQNAHAARALEIKERAYAIKEVQEVTGFGKTTVFAAIKAGNLVARKYGGRTVVLDSDLNAFLKNLPRVTR